VPLENCRIGDKEWGCLFSCLSGEALKLFREGSNLRNYRRGQIIQHQGDEPAFVFCIRTGFVKLYKTTPLDHEVVVRLLGTCDVAGFRPVLAGERISVFAEALEPCEVCIIPKSVFLSVFDASAALHAAILKYMAREWRISEEGWLASLSDSTEHRVQSVLSQLARRRKIFPKTKRGAITVSVPRVEIARIVGVTPSTVSRVLRGLAKRGMVKLHPRTIDVISISGS
jgi:CRP-like cAMP-binding protein